MQNFFLLASLGVIDLRKYNLTLLQILVFSNRCGLITLSYIPGFLNVQYKLDIYFLTPIIFQFYTDLVFAVGEMGGGKH